MLSSTPVVHSTSATGTSLTVKGDGHFKKETKPPAKTSASCLGPTQFSGLGLDAASGVLSRLYRETKSIVSLPATSEKKNIPAKVSSTTASRGGKSRSACPVEVEELIIRLTTEAYKKMKTQTNKMGEPLKQVPFGTKASIQASAKVLWIKLRSGNKGLPVPACFELDEPHAMRGKVKSTFFGIFDTIYTKYKPKLDGSKSTNHPDVASYYGMLSPESKKVHISKANARANERNTEVQLARAQSAAQREGAEEEVFLAFSPEAYDRIKAAAEKNEVLHVLLQTQLPKELFTAIGLEKLDESVLSKYEGKKILFYFGTSQEHNFDIEKLRFLCHPSTSGGDDLGSCGSDSLVLSIKKGSGMFEANKSWSKSWRNKRHFHILSRDQCIDDLGFETIVIYKSPLELAVRSGEDTLQYGTDHLPIASSDSPVEGEPLTASRLWKQSGAGSKDGMGNFILFFTFAIFDPQDHPDLAFYTGEQNQSTTSLPERMRKAKSTPLPSIPVINRVEKSGDFVEAAIELSTFQDAVVCFTGDLPGMTTAEAVKAALSMGAERASVYYTNETTLLVRGKQKKLKSGNILSAKEKRALNDETPVISAADFVELYENMKSE